MIKYDPARFRRVLNTARKFGLGGTGTIDKLRTFNVAQEMKKKQTVKPARRAAQLQTFKKNIQLLLSYADFLRTEYYGRGKSIRHIADDLGCDYHTIVNHMDFFGFEQQERKHYRSPAPSTEAERIRDWIARTTRRPRK